MDTNKIKTEAIFDRDECDASFEVYLNDIYIGGALAHLYDDEIEIELLSIKEEFRGKGYGSKAFKQYIELATKEGIKFIKGDAQIHRIAFYKRLGAKFECRVPGDETLINDVFYIDL